MYEYVYNSTMNENVFNSSHEFSYRILLLLKAYGRLKVSVDRLAALDFITVYGNDFGISEMNLHGNNRFRFSEYTCRRKSVKDALRNLVIIGYVQFHSLDNGFLYSITLDGEKACEKMNDEYATKYSVNASLAIQFCKKMSDRQITRTINNYSINVAKEG